jgi:hypothetical protein
MNGLSARADGPPPNNGMHPTADMPALINSRDAGRRVMPGVRRRYDEGERCSEEPGGGRRIAARAGLRVSWAPPNMRMHATRDTKDVIERNLVGGRVMRGVRLLLRYSPLPN